MIDWSNLRDMIWEARWDGLVIFAQAIWTSVLTHWWFGPLLLVILVTLSGKAWLRLIRYVGTTYLRGGTAS